MNKEQSQFNEEASCPCGTGQTYAVCCKEIHESLPLGSGAETCEQLMRSRYSAYVTGRVDYLVETTHPRSREKGLEEGIKRSMGNTKWLGLSVIRVIQGGPQDKVGKVEFIAKLSEQRHSGKVIESKIHELSRFSRFEGRWIYVDGDLY